MAKLELCDAIVLASRSYARRQAKKRSAGFFVRIVRDPMHGPRLCCSASARLGLALGQIGAQLRGQTLLASLAHRALGRACFAHAASVAAKNKKELTCPTGARQGGGSKRHRLATFCGAHGMGGFGTRSSSKHGEPPLLLVSAHLPLPSPATQPVPGSPMTCASCARHL